MGRLGWFLGGLGFAAAVARFVRGDRGAVVAPPPASPLPPAPVAVAAPPAPVARPEPERVAEPEPEPKLSVEPQLDEPQPPSALEPGEEGEVDPRAEELRRRLDESRTLVEEREEFESGETTVDNVEVAVATRDLPDPDERRKQVHEEGQAVIDRMKGENA